MDHLVSDPNVTTLKLSQEVQEMTEPVHVVLLAAAENGHLIAISEVACFHYRPR
jgi:hypothetical protein